MLYFIETVIRVSTDGTDPNIQNQDNLQIQQNTEERPFDRMIDTNGGQPPINSNVSNSNSNGKVHKNQSADEDEQNLITSPVYQQTTENMNEKRKSVSTALRGSVASLHSFEKVRGVNCRTVLWYVTFVGFMVNYMLRINMNIAIVEMVARKPTTTNHHTSECMIDATLNSTAVNERDVSFVSLHLLSMFYHSMTK